MRLSARDQIIIAVVVIIVVVVVGVFLLILPRFGRLGSLADEMRSVETEKQQAQTLLDRRKDAKAQAAETQLSLMDVANRVPDAPELPGLIIELQDIANEADLEFMQVSPGDLESVEGEQYLLVPVTVRLEGTWEQLIEFVGAVDGLRRDVQLAAFTVEVVEPDFDNEPQDEWYWNVSAQLALEAYMMDLGGEAAAAVPAPGGSAPGAGEPTPDGGSSDSDAEMAQ